MGKYKTKITEYGYELINQALLSKSEILTDGWYIALGTGELEPDFKTTRLNNIVFDKNSPDYPGIIISENNKSRYAEIVIPESLAGMVITEIGLFDEKDRLFACANTKLDCTERTEEGFDIDYRARIDLGAVNSDVVIQFQGGTFQLLEEKGKADGYAPLDDKKKVPLKHLQSPYTPFCFNSGLVDENGEAALLQLNTVSVAPEVPVDASETEPFEDNGESGATVESKIITLKAPAVYTDGNGKTVTISEDLTLDVTNFAPGTYSLRVAETVSGIEFTAVDGAKVYRQKNPPENPVDGDLWQNLSVAPHLAYIYTVSTADEDAEITPAGIWQITNQVEVGIYTVPAAPAKGDENSETAQIGGGGEN